jgi:phage baseplate assembly protein V
MEDTMNLRSGVVRGVVQAIDDTGEVQMATVQSHDGGPRQVEVWQLDGFASAPSGDGAVALLLSVGNDPSQFVALLANPSTRFGKQAAGERTMSAPDGTRVAVRQGGVVEIWGGNQVIVNSPTLTVTASGDVTVTASGTVTVTAPTVTIAASGGLTIDGNVQVNGNLVASGTVKDSHATL